MEFLKSEVAFDYHGKKEDGKVIRKDANNIIVKIPAKDEELLALLPYPTDFRMLKRAWFYAKYMTWDKLGWGVLRLDLLTLEEAPELHRLLPYVIALHRRFYDAIIKNTPQK